MRAGVASQLQQSSAWPDRGQLRRDNRVSISGRSGSLKFPRPSPDCAADCYMCAGAIVVRFGVRRVAANTTATDPPTITRPMLDLCSAPYKARRFAPPAPTRGLRALTVACAQIRFWQLRDGRPRAWRVSKLDGRGQPSSIKAATGSSTNAWRRGQYVRSSRSTSFVAQLPTRSHTTFGGAPLRTLRR